MWKQMTFAEEVQTLVELFVNDFILLKSEYGVETSGSYLGELENDDHEMKVTIEIKPKINFDEFKKEYEAETRDFIINHETGTIVGDKNYDGY